MKLHKGVRTQFSPIPFTLLFFSLLCSSISKSDPKPASESWLLPSFLEMTSTHPERLIKIASQLFSPERVAKASKNPDLAHEWQHRAAMTHSLTAFFSDEKITKSKAYQNQARPYLKAALMEDPSLLVRDSAVEAIGRIIRMQPQQAGKWKGLLEQAFLAPQNVVQGEGLFIRESILKLMRESNLTPSKKVKKAAQADLNPQVPYLLKGWNTNAFDTL